MNLFLHPEGKGNSGKGCRVQSVRYTVLHREYPGGTELAHTLFM